MKVFSFIFVLVITCSNLKAEPAVVLDPLPCFYAIERQFFNEAIVIQSLSFYRIRQELWSPILKKLRGNQVEITQRLKKKDSFYGT